MTLTIEVTPELEALLRERAARDGVEVERYILEAAEAKARNDAQNNTTPRKEAARRGFGMLAGSSRTVDAFLQERREEAATEMRQANERDQMHSHNPQEQAA